MEESITSNEIISPQSTENILQAFNRIRFLVDEFDQQLFCGVTALFFGLFLWWFLVLTANLKNKSINNEDLIWKYTFRGGVLFFLYLLSIYYIFPNKIGSIATSIRLIAQIYTAILATVAFVIAYLNFSRKSDTHFKSYYQCASDQTNENNKAVINIWLKNEKDRAEAIFSIYLKLEGEKYLLLKNCIQDPILIPAYGVKKITLLNSVNPQYKYFHDNKYTGEPIGRSLGKKYNAMLNFQKNPIIIQTPSGSYSTEPMDIRSDILKNSEIIELSIQDQGDTYP